MYLWSTISLEIYDNKQQSVYCLPLICTVFFSEFKSELKKATTEGTENKTKLLKKKEMKKKDGH